MRDDERRIETAHTRRTSEHETRDAGTVVQTVAAVVSAGAAAYQAYQGRKSKEKK